MSYYPCVELAAKISDSGLLRLPRYSNADPHFIDQNFKWPQLLIVWWKLLKIGHTYEDPQKAAENAIMQYFQIS